MGRQRGGRENSIAGQRFDHDGDDEEKRNVFTSSSSSSSSSLFILRLQ